MDETEPGLMSDDDLQRLSVRELKPQSVSITLCDYDPEWPLLFAREHDRIRATLGAAALHVEHVGSTSVPGLIAKAHHRHSPGGVRFRRRGVLPAGPA